MRTWTIALAAALTACLAACASLAPIKPVTGEQLVNDLWKMMKANDQKGLEQFMAPGFQVVHENGAIAKTEELALINNLKMSDYQLSDLKVTRFDDIIVVSYKVTVAETIDGKRLAKAPAMRLSVFAEDDGGWQWVAHANLRPVQ